MLLQDFVNKFFKKQISDIIVDDCFHLNSKFIQHAHKKVFLQLEHLIELLFYLQNQY